jgi:hypothetical protein
MRKTNFFRFVGLIALSLGPACPLLAQGEARDTSGFGYRIGYEIGSWLPFLIIVVLMLLIIRKMAQQRQG